MSIEHWCMTNSQTPLHIIISRSAYALPMRRAVKISRYVARVQKSKTTAFRWRRTCRRLSINFASTPKYKSLRWFVCHLFLLIVISLGSIERFAVGRELSGMPLIYPECSPVWVACVLWVVLHSCSATVTVVVVLVCITLHRQIQ